MTTPPWNPSGALLNARHWNKALSGPKTRSAAFSLNTLSRFTTGAGSTALWAINHLWTLKTKTSKTIADYKYKCPKKGGKGNVSSACSGVADKLPPVPPPIPFRVQGSGFKVQGSRFKVQGSM